MARIDKNTLHTLWWFLIRSILTQSNEQKIKSGRLGLEPVSNDVRHGLFLFTIIK